jgi:alkylation response protein AidB-like acyl-CoA dehydrogenase
MDFELNAEQRAWQGRARAFAEEEIRPLSLAREAIADPVKTFDWEIIKKGSQLGFRTAVVPKEWGGHGIDHVTQALVMSELARADSAISKTFSQCWKFSHRIARACTPDQRERFLTPFLEDDTFLIGGASTEPNAGSDNRLQPENDPRAGLKLRAERQGDDWLLNGDKCFIANGSVAKLFFISTRTNPEVKLREGNTVFLLPRGTPGFRHAKVFNKAGWRFYQNAELILENVRLPQANVVGEVNGGLKTRTRGSLDFSDFELAANALGNCDAAVESAMQYVRHDGLVSQQRVQLQLAEMHMLTEALRAYVMRVAWEMDAQMRESANVGLVMNFACDVSQRVAVLNMEIHGGGAQMHAHSDKLVRDTIIWTHLAGDSVQRMKSVRRLLR